MAVQLIDAGVTRLRHIAPTATWPSEGGTFTVLGRSYGFTELPISRQPTSADLVEGSYTTRLGDSGEFSLTFPNVAGSKGLWRDRFDPDLSKEFLEFYRDSVLEFVGSIQRVEIDRGGVTVSGADAWSLLRRAYERDRHWTAAPRDVVEAYTRVPVAVVADDFPGNSLDVAWSTTQGTSAVSGGIVRLTTGASFIGRLRRAVALTDTWKAQLRVIALNANGGGAPTVRLEVFDSPETLEVARMAAGGTTADLKGQGVGVSLPIANLPDQLPVTLHLERKGRWIYGFVNGKLINILPVGQVTAAFLRVAVDGSVSGATADFDLVTLEDRQPFLARGSDKGDYVLPGDYPTGGLRGRYFNNADLVGYTFANRAERPMAPNREHYAERLDDIATFIPNLTPVPAGTPAGGFYSVRWFGAIYLRGDIGNYTFETDAVYGCRLWIGKTAWGDQLINDWDSPPSSTVSAIWNAANHGSDAGWYPIVLELFVETGSGGISLQFTPPGTTYTDPGGTSITASTKRVVPKTSFSPLGCYDNRIQGQPHFDLVQQAAQQFGYQIMCEPMQLESGEFPGRVVPRVRVGRDTDVVLEVEDDDRNEPIFSPGLTLDGSDQTVTLIGTGAGQADGSGSQVTSEVTDIAALGSALFGLQTWVDAADVAFPDLLAARLNAEFALRATPWEEVRGTPRAQERLADTWPLSQTLSAMRWRPGDGIRLRVPDVGVEDDAPRQLLQVTRAFMAEGRTGTQVAFRQRPRSAQRSVRGLLQAALQSQRSYQRQKVTLETGYVSTPGVGGAGFSGYGLIPLLPQDEVVKATLRIVLNTAGTSLGVEINGTDRTAALGGGWTLLPTEVDVTSYATQASSTDNRLYARMQNNGGVATGIEWAMFVEVLR